MWTVQGYNMGFDTLPICVYRLYNLMTNIDIDTDTDTVDEKKNRGLNGKIIDTWG